MRELTLFLQQALTNKSVCAVAPTSRPTVRRICREVPKDRPLVVVEYGPGTGALTRYFLRELHPDSVILGIELNRAFVDELESLRAQQPQGRPKLIIENGNCADIVEILAKHLLPPADLVFSGIPFSMLDEALRDTIVQRTYQALAPGGTFVVYQYSWLMLARLARHFPRVDKDYSIWHIPPNCIMRARKRSEGELNGSSLKSGTTVAAAG